jgi:hypothetical protein
VRTTSRRHRYFDHMSIDYNRVVTTTRSSSKALTHDFHMYTVSETWRTIMRSVTPLFVIQVTASTTQKLQSTESGKAFFDMEQCYEPFLPHPEDAPVQPGSFTTCRLASVTLHTPQNSSLSGIHSLNAVRARGMHTSWSTLD